MQDIGATEGATEGALCSKGQVVYDVAPTCVPVSQSMHGGVLHHLQLRQCNPGPSNHSSSVYEMCCRLHNLYRVTLLMLAYDDRAPGRPGVLDVLNHLYMTSSPVLFKVHMLAMELDSPSQDDMHKVYIALQHIHQEVGMLGSFSSRRADTRSGSILQLGYQLDQQLLQPC